MNARLSNFLSQISNLGILAVALFAPLIFWDLTTEFYETPKFLLLLGITGILLLIWMGKSLAEGKLSASRASLDLPFILLLIIFVISTFFATSRSVAIFGNIPHIHGGTAVFAVLILFYFVLASNLKKAATAKQVTNLLLISGVVLSLLSIFSYFGQNLLGLPWTYQTTFTPAGSNFSATAILALLLPIPLMSLLQGQTVSFTFNVKNIQSSFKGRRWKELGTGNNELINKLLRTSILVLFTATIALTGTWITMVTAGAAVLLTLLAVPQENFRKNLLFVVIPFALAVLILILSFSPIGGSQNILYNKSQNFPKEVQLPLGASWKISISAFRDSPFWGTGPGSYLANFTLYKPAEFNSSKLWNVRFDQAFNEYLDFLATLGAMGLISLLLLTATFFSLAFRVLKQDKDLTLSALAISGIIFFLTLTLHASTMTLWIIGILVITSFLALDKHSRGEEYIDLGNKLTGKNTGVKFDTLPTALFIITLLLVGAAFYFAGRFVYADYYHRQAIIAVANNLPLNAYNELVKAEHFNPYVDLYRTDLAQTNFALANALAASKGPTETSPSGSLTDTDKQNIQTLLSRAINEGRAATVINPNNPSNWEVLGSIYRQISGVAQNSLAFSLDSYGRAIQRDPLNPLLRLYVGGIYYSVKNYDMAIRFFTDAINLKPDYANAYYNLSMALKEKGDLQGAAAVAEKTVSLLDSKDPDYKVASDLLASLKDETATKSAEKEAINNTKPTPTPTSALQNKKLPKVLDLPDPEKIATPPAVNKPKPSE